MKAKQMRIAKGLRQLGVCPSNIWLSFKQCKRWGLFSFRNWRILDYSDTLLDVASAAKVDTIDVTRLEKGRYVLPPRRKRILAVLGMLDEGATNDQ